MFIALSLSIKSNQAKTLILLAQLESHIHMKALEGVNILDWQMIELGGGVG
jgi:hypothetical protein